MSQRMFIAAWAEELAPKAEQLQSRLKRADARVSWIGAEQLHLTVKFLGETVLTYTAKICQALAEVARQHDPLELELAGVGAFPDLQRPRTLWVGVREGQEAMAALHADVDEAMAELRYAPDRRFNAHLTLGRVRSQHHAAELAELLEENADFELGRLAVSELRLVASQLTPEGPVYEVIGRAELGAD